MRAFLGVMFGVGGIQASILGPLGDVYGMDRAFHLCSYLPLIVIH